MMLVQFAMAHHKIARLNRRSAEADTPEAARVYDASSSTLLNEFRRMGLAIKTYREPAPQSHVTVVKQQNLAQNQQVAFVEAAPVTAEPAKLPEKRAHDSQLTSAATLKWQCMVPHLFVACVVCPGDGVERTSDDASFRVVCRCRSN